jgi:hypothetical protein
VFALFLAALAPLYRHLEKQGDYKHGAVISAPAGQIENLYSFCALGDGFCGDGANPVGGVALLGDGSIIGTTTQGGSGAGTIFRLTNGANGWQLQVIWNVCWVFEDCGYYGTAQGSLQLVGTDNEGQPVLKGVCESARSGRGVLYKLTVVNGGGYRIEPVNYWGKNGPAPPIVIIP